MEAKARRRRRKKIRVRSRPKKKSKNLKRQMRRNLLHLKSSLLSRRKTTPRNRKQTSPRLKTQEKNKNRQITQLKKRPTSTHKIRPVPKRGHPTSQMKPQKEQKPMKQTLTRHQHLRTQPFQLPTTLLRTTQPPQTSKRIRPHRPRTHLSLCHQSQMEQTTLIINRIQSSLQTKLKKRSTVRRRMRMRCQKSLRRQLKSFGRSCKPPT